MLYGSLYGALLCSPVSFIGALPLLAVGTLIFQRTFSEGLALTITVAATVGGTTTGIVLGAYAGLKGWLFDDVGVWPILTKLGNGTVLASYGRPGLYVRTLSAQAIAEERFEPEHWGEPVPVVPPGALQTETCSYSDLSAIDDDTAMIAYSDFNVPDDEGQPRKSIMVREVSIT